MQVRAIRVAGMFRTFPTLHVEAPRVVVAIVHHHFVILPDFRYLLLLYQMQSLMRSICALLCTESSCHDYFHSFKASLGVIKTSEFANSSFASSETLAPKSMALFGEVAYVAPNFWFDCFN
jgi:hypothetical protein